MPVLIDEARYFSAVDIANELGVSRTTFWRWRSEGSIPPGRKYRGRMVVFTQDEVESIRAFANRLEPIETANRNQLKLFNGSRRGDSNE